MHYKVYYKTQGDLGWHERMTGGQLSCDGNQVC